MDVYRQGLIRALCFHDVCGYAPTRIELFSSFDSAVPLLTNGSPPAGGDFGELSRTGVRGGGRERLGEVFQELKNDQTIIESRGRVIFPGREVLIQEHESREALFPRKIKRARQVARWLARLSGVRFVALCNTTALAHARDDGDLDFFVVTRRGTLWQTRALAVLPFKILKRRPQEDRAERDAVCLSFFVDDIALDLSSLQLNGDDPYFRHWFLSLLPLHDDGVSTDLWNANAAITTRHPFARPWIVNKEYRIKNREYRIPTCLCIESLARRLQSKAFPTQIRSLMNVDTRVVVNDHVLKFHVEDGRTSYRDAYQTKCQTYGIEF
ncbi:MAG: hypothetical protein Q7N87_02765 [Candidatus Uhrbacteria bacterium]|nr:hypothetical protein [Candidatus Uhrbacteria bacterium]